MPWVGRRPLRVPYRRAFEEEHVFHRGCLALHPAGRDKPVLGVLAELVLSVRS